MDTRECAICLDNLDEENGWKCEECDKCVHLDCAREWFKHKKQCALCRSDIRPRSRSYSLLDTESSATDSESDIESVSVHEEEPPQVRITERDICDPLFIKFTIYGFSTLVSFLMFYYLYFETN